MKKILLLILIFGLGLFMSSCEQVREFIGEADEMVDETSPVDEAYWYWDYNVKWTVCTINGEQFENIFFIWTNLGQTIVDEEGNAIYMSEMNIERCKGVVERIVYDDWDVIQETRE